MTELQPRARINLDNQGFCDLSDSDKARYARPLRFTPIVATALVVTGLALQSPALLGVMSLVGLSGALFPRGMLIDVVYNFGIRRLFHAPPLPATPTPRRFSYGISATWLAISALSFHYGHPVVGFLFGVPVAIGGTVLATTLWCFGSWLYHRWHAIIALLPGDGSRPLP